MVGLIAYSIIVAGVVGVIQNIIFVYVQKKFGFNFPQRKLDNRISVRKLKQYLKINRANDPHLLKWLHRIVFLDRVIHLIFAIVVLEIIYLVVATVSFLY